MKTAMCVALLGAMMIVGVQEGRTQAIPIHRVHKRTAALMLSGGENAICQIGNINDAWVVTVSVGTNPQLSRYISGGGGCMVLPINLSIGTQIQITGVLQDTAAIPGGVAAAAATVDPSAVTEDCFNVEGFSVGLSADGGSQFDPNDSANIVNSQGYGFLYDDTDSDIKPGPYSYTITGCSGGDCPVQTSYYNTDSSPNPGDCTVLQPFPEFAQR